MNARQITYIEGRETWWAVCCAHECEASYIGPHLTLEAAQEECAVEECTYAHFIARFIPPFARAHMTHAVSRGLIYDADPDLQIYAARWVAAHNDEAKKHPLWRESSTRYVDEDEVHKAFEVSL